MTTSLAAHAPPPPDDIPDKLCAACIHCGRLLLLHPTMLPIQGVVCRGGCEPKPGRT